MVVVESVVVVGVVMVDVAMVDVVVVDVVVVNVVWEVVDMMLELSCICGKILSNIGAQEGGPDRQPTHLQETRRENVRKIKNIIINTLLQLLKRKQYIENILF